MITIMKKRSVGEPVQVYLDPAERARLQRLAHQLDTTKSDVVRRGLEALERQVFDPQQHPALRLIGIADAARKRATPYDVAVEHDRALAESEEASWGRRAPPAARRRGRRAR